MDNEGYVKLHRKMIKWEWYEDINTKVLFLHCLLRANYKDQKWRGSTVKRGSFATSIRHLAKETGLTERQTRTALEHLISTHEVTQQSKGNYSIITVVSYDKYQNTDTENDTRPTQKRHTTDTRPTSIEERKEVYVPLTGEHIQGEGKKSAAPSAADGGDGSPEWMIEHYGLVTVSHIRTFADSVGGDAYSACDFLDAFKKSGTRMPDNWRDIYIRYLEVDEATQDKFIADLKAGVYREKWGMINGTG